MSRVVLGVSGGIAAYKACHLVRLFRESGHEIRVVPTANALEFVGTATWEALSGQPVHTSVFADVPAVPHVAMGQSADLVLVAPATADLVARAAAGRADDLLTSVLLTAACPVVLAPAMHTEMWRHPATQRNVATLRSFGYAVLDPADGRLTGADSGPGRLPEPEDIFATASAILAAPELAARLSGQDFSGKRVVVSAGGTHEALDPVRFIGNSSSGKMGAAIARAARARGAEVTVVGANLQVPVPAGVSFASATSTADLFDAVVSASEGADVVVMAAAPADFRPAVSASSKIKKFGNSGITVELEQTADILKALGQRRPPGQILVGFAAETAGSPDELLRLGQEKLARKGAQLLVLNDVSGGQVFGQDANDVTIISPEGEVARAFGSKDLVAHRILDAVFPLGHA